jgi:hypothetical protein
MESHDEERIVFKNINFGNNSNASYNIRDTSIALERMELNAAFLLTIPGPKMLWQFGEIGYDYSITSCHPGNFVPQPYPDDSCRLSEKPVRWDYLQEERRRKVFNTYSRLAALRAHPWYRQAFMAGSTEQSLNGAMKWIKLNADTSRLVVIGNFGVTAATGSFTFPLPGTWYDYLDSTTFSATGSVQNISLQPGEFRVYLNRNIHNITTTPVINIPSSGTLLEAKIYPNPAPRFFHVELYVPQTGKTKIELFATNGQQLRNLFEANLVKGKHMLDLSHNGLASGIYYVRITSGQQSRSLPITIQ